MRLPAVGIFAPSAQTWQGVTDDVFDAVENITIRSMQKVIEIAKNDDDLWIIVDCR